jgi:hypothetical protein
MSDLKNMGVMLTQEQFDKLTGIHAELRALRESNEKIAAAVLVNAELQSEFYDFVVPDAFNKFLKKIKEAK